MNSGHLKAAENQNRSINAQSGLSAQDGDQSYTIPTQRLAPTQRVSEVCCSPCFVVDAPLTPRGFEDYLTEPNKPSYTDDQTNQIQYVALQAVPLPRRRPHDLVAKAYTGLWCLCLVRASYLL
jgi:hypothetical protein